MHPSIVLDTPLKAELWKSAKLSNPSSSTNGSRRERGQKEVAERETPSPACTLNCCCPPVTERETPLPARRHLAGNSPASRCQSPELWLCHIYDFHPFFATIGFHIVPSGTSNYEQGAFSIRKESKPSAVVV
ncbi:hypothetical protein DM860_006593 [Cuscuta australis]|uniref:Uncharacterized protein n=1 Tax=Cuscuta australis TaxID=267555 RepID=A0A328D944_9ASTE|nr:hypothetical protein DM860_006593 [Cuscuta australis]